MRIRDWSSDVCASDLLRAECAVGERCLRRWRRDQVLRPRKAIEGPWHIGVEFTAPVDGIDIESERILAQHVGRSGRLDLDGQHRGPARGAGQAAALIRSEEHTSELQSLMRISYAVFCLKKKT